MLCFVWRCPLFGGGEERLLFGPRKNVGPASVYARVSGVKEEAELGEDASVC